MDEDSGPIQTLEPEEIDAPEMQSYSGGSDIRDGLQSAAKNAKETLGSAKSGAGDGIGNALKNGLGSVGGAGSSKSNPLSGLSGAGKSMDGMKLPGGDKGAKTPNMFKGMEDNSNPLGKNDTSGDKGNPSASDSAKKMAAKGAEKIQEAKEAVKDAKDVSRIAATGGTDAAAWLDLLKRALKDPKAFIKRFGKYILVGAGGFFLQFILIAAILGAIFFGIYKVYLAGAEVWRNPTRVVTELRVGREMADFLVDTVPQLVYERELEEQKKSGVAVAQTPPPTVRASETNPETSKMFEAWDNAGLANTFLDDFNGRFVKIEGRDGSNLNDWQLFVNNQNFGLVSGTKAQAYIGLFAEETTHWNDIYTREALQGVASNEFNTESFKLDLPDSENNIGVSRQNSTRQLVSSTAVPVSERSESYYTCLISGESSCDSLGLGSSGSPSNDPTAESKGWLGGLIQQIQQFRNDAKNQALLNQTVSDNLGRYSTGVADQIEPETSTYSLRDRLAANIRTGASDTILSSLPKNPDDGTTPDPDVLLDLYDRFQTSTTNNNFARINYDRESHQSVALSENYFIAGGQLLNNEISLLDSWTFSENLSILSESPIFTASVIGNPIGVFAQTTSNSGSLECQRIFNDGNPVGEISANQERGVSENSCFRRSLIPNATELSEDVSVNQMYKELEKKNRDADQNGGQFGKLVGAAIPKYQSYVDNEIRTSPVATESIGLSSELNPEFDGYTNQVHGVARTGAEINGEAVDSMYTAAEALWSKVMIDETYGMGGEYLDDTEFAQIQRYAQKIEREKMAFKPLSERLFAMKDPGSLAGKLAMLTPTNRSDGAERALALLSPSNLTSAVASRMVTPTFAQNTAPVNPLHAVRTGIPLGDPSNRMSGSELWEQYNCDAGGPAQETSQPEGIPFTLPSNSNPCKREAVISRITTCYFDTEDSCSFEPSGGSSTPGAITDDSSATPCYTGSDDLGVRDDAYTEGRQIRIRLCAINGMSSSSEESVPGPNQVPGADGRALASSIASEAWVKLVQLAQQQGVPLNASSSFRTMDHQQRLCADSSGCGTGAVATPGFSNHQSGTAMDIAEATGNISIGASCESPATVGTATYQFLEANARTFGIKHYAAESWHWGTNESC